jgi:hypothetical protein
MKSSAATIDRWLNWKPEPPTEKKPKQFPRGEEPTKPTKAPFVGFVGTPPPGNAPGFFQNGDAASTEHGTRHTVLARVRGQEISAMSDQSEVCFHCEGMLTCDCASCGRGMVGAWKVDQCGCCKGTGYLAWGKVQ